MKTNKTTIDLSKTIDKAMPCSKPKLDERQLTDVSRQHNFLTENHYDMANSNTTKKVEIYERATQRVIALMEKGDVAWRRTWGVYGFAKNHKSGHIYTGINFLFLNLLSPHPIPYYLTFKQVKEMGGKIKKGAKAEQVYFYTGYYKDENGKNVSEADAHTAQFKDANLTPVRFLKYYNVFNIEDTENIEWERPESVDRPNNPIEECEVLIRDMPEAPTFKIVDANRAFYSPLEDIINVPNIKQFENSEFFYRTTFHEIAHWTGHETRLNRPGITEAIEQGSDRYAEEELVAELTSNYLLNIAGISNSETEKVSAGYLKSWVGRLKENPKILFKVAPKAQQATEFILGKSITEL